MCTSLILRHLYPARPINNDFLLRRIDEGLYASTSLYITDCLDAFVDSRDPHAAMQRFTIESITLKDVQYQRLYVTVSDTKNPPNTAQLCIKSTASDEYVPEYFYEHSDSTNVLDAILSVVEDSDMISPSVSPSSQTCDSDRPPSRVSQLTLVDQIPQTSTHNVYRSATSVTGHGNKKDQDHGQVIREINPNGLNLFDLALLAEVVHQQDRLYSIFQNQSYWYANLICNAVVALYGCKEQDTRGVAYYQDEVFIPPNDRLPKLAGQRKRIPIGNVEDAVLPVILARFEQVRKEQMDAFSIAAQKKLDKDAQSRAYNAKRLQDWQRQLSELERTEENCAREIAALYEEPRRPDAAERQREIEFTQKEARELYVEITREMKLFQKVYGTYRTN